MSRMLGVKYKVRRAGLGGVSKKSPRGTVSPYKKYWLSRFQLPLAL